MIWRSIFFLAVIGTASSARTAEISTRTIAELGQAAIVLKGDIDQNDSSKGIAAIERILTSEKSVGRYLVLDSAGGSLDDAMILGRYIRARGLATVVLNGGKCASACADLFFAGYDKQLGRMKRIAFPGAVIGVHQAFLRFESSDTRKKSLDDVSAIYADLQARIGQRVDYLLEMGASASVIALALSTKPTGMAQIDTERLRDSDVILPKLVAGTWAVDTAHAQFNLFPAATGPDPTALPVPADRVAPAVRAQPLTNRRASPAPQ